jgi:hypothetical protein
MLEDAIMTAWIFACWYCLGVWGFVHWWRKDYDLTSRELLLVVACGVLGPLSWLMGYIIHGKHHPVILRRRP